MSVSNAPGGMLPKPDLRAAWFAVWILMGFHALSFMDRLILTLLAVPIQDDLGISDIQLGLLQGFAFAILFALVGLPIGWLVDRLSRRAIIFGGVLLWSIATVSSGFNRTFAGLALARAGVGAGEASLSPAAFSMMADMFPRERLAAAIGTYFLGANIGAALALTLGGLLIAIFTGWGGIDVPVLGHFAPWQMTFIAIGLPGMVAALLIFLVKEPPRRAPPPSRSGLGDFAKFLVQKRRLLTFHFLGFPVLALTVYAIQGWAAVYMSRQFGWSTALIGLVMAVAVGLCGGVANVVAGRVADRMLHRGILDAYFRLHVGTTIVAIPILLAAFATKDALLFILLFCVGKGMLTSFGGPSLATLQLVAPDRLRGQLSALYLLILALVGTGMGPLVTALVTEWVLQDRAQVGTSILIIVAVAAPFGAVMLALGMGPLRRELARTAPDHGQVIAAH